jgi:hypothetical protein
MSKLRLLQAGLVVYITILITSFLHVLHAFLAYSDKTIQLGSLSIPGWWSGLGVAIGLDLAIIYFSFVSVFLQTNEKDAQGKTIQSPGALAARYGATWAMLLVWFAVVYSMVWQHLQAGEWVPAFIGFILSLFVPLTSLRVGQVLGEIAKLPETETRPQEYLPLTSLARIIDRDVKEVLAAIRNYEQGEVRLLRRGKDWLVHSQDVEVVRAAVFGYNERSRTAQLTPAT